MATDLRVHNPMGYPPRLTRSIWRRVSATWPGRPSTSWIAASTTAISWLNRWRTGFARTGPTYRSEVRRKSGVYTERDEALYTEIQRKGAGAVMAVGH